MSDNQSSTISHALDYLQNQDIDLLRLISQSLSALIDLQLYFGLFNALKAHILAAVFFIIGIILMLNPLVMAGFGFSGPIAGSLAAAWQSTMGGTVAAGSAFAIIQSCGMSYSVAIPVVGTIITAGSIVAATAGEQIKYASHYAWVIANACGQEVGRWSRGDYGSPFTNWWNGTITAIQ